MVFFVFEWFLSRDFEQRREKIVFVARKMHFDTIKNGNKWREFPFNANLS